MNYGFVIDTRSCIGCHACSTACKSENEVPIGVNRTWVKYTESGRYPDARRSFQVNRCNHCANPPCVRICPVEAMYQRSDGIVEFNGDSCIGCKACLQACPYDAIYIDPATGTAAKCHFCAHRIEQGLEPACVVVCPTHSIIAGDMDDPGSEIARVLARNDTTVRKPEQGTAPKLFYIQGHDTSAHPTALPREPRSTMFADVLDAHGRPSSPDYADATFYEVKLRFEEEAAPLHSVASGAQVRSPGRQGVPGGGPIHGPPSSMAGHMVSQVGYTVWHKVPWHWQVPAYLVTKAVGAGAFLVMCLLALTNFGAAPGVSVALGFIGLLGVLATTALLVFDLEHPERFLRILTRPQWKSWLTRGAFLLVAFANVGAGWWALSAGAWMGWLVVPASVHTLLAAVTAPLAVGAAIYTAFLFAQCEGRDLWQSPLLPFHLLVQALMAGAAVALVVGGLAGDAGLSSAATSGLVSMLVLDLFLILAGEFAIPHASEVAARAAHAISHGRHAKDFWVGAILLGHVVPLALLPLLGAPWLAALVAGLVLFGLYRYEHVFVTAPQEIPNS